MSDKTSDSVETLKKSKFMGKAGTNKLCPEQSRMNFPAVSRPVKSYT